MKNLVLLLATACMYFANAQDPYYLNTNQSLVSLNPSFAGCNGGVRNQLSYRHQWPNLSTNFVTYQNTFDAYIKPLKAGVAVSLLSDDAAHGTLKSSLFSISYAQYLNFKDGDLKVIPSVQLGYGHKSLDRGNLNFGDMIDPRYGKNWTNFAIIPAQNKSYLNISAGMLVNYKKNLYAGVSVFNLNQPDIGLMGSNKLPFRFASYISYNFHLSEQVNLQAFCRGNYQNNFFYGQSGVNAIFKNHFIVGAACLGDKGAAVNLGFRARFFTVQAGYDATIYKDGMGMGSWEGHLSFSFPSKEQFKSGSNFENY
ncbi:hypothetical protein CNR22_09455 [Sphingobacteriaceae bacterium]|nr:hypothetical protein CNR22_09455 [Sphingobacteriaceae bacterium]